MYVMDKNMVKRHNRASIKIINILAFDFHSLRLESAIFGLLRLD